VRRNDVKDRKSLIFVANDKKKPAARTIARDFGPALERQYGRIYATAGTAKLIQPYLKHPVERLSHGPAGGDVEAAQLMFKLGGHADIFFLVDPMHEPHESHKDLLIRVCQSNDWAIYTTPASVDGYLRALAQKNPRRARSEPEKPATPPIPLRAVVLPKASVAANDKSEALALARTARGGRRDPRL
jgi:methylglyoxal synthase